MANGKNVFAIDAGNTAIKVARFSDDTLVEVKRFKPAETAELSNFLGTVTNRFVVLSSVLDRQETDHLIRIAGPQSLHVTNRVKLPVQLSYETPDTLGIDRICNASAVYNMMNSRFGLSIDIGTCVKFDLVSDLGVYLGGSISPGIDLRYRSLNDYTGNLPLISNKTIPNLVGSSTQHAISSGVMNGIFHEIKGMMGAYEERYEDLTFFVTGGDSPNFELQSKNNIFADENLTLKGLYEIYKINA